MSEAPGATSSGDRRDAAGAPPVGVAVVGCGAWGKNLVRVLDALPGCDLRWACDVDERRLVRLAAPHPRVRTTTDLGRVLDDSAVQAVAIATPAVTHRALALEALAAGRDVYVEKPLALSVADAEAIVAAAAAHGRTLMVGHLLLYHPAVLHLRRLLSSGELGAVRYLHSQRVNLGVVRRDENALWSFAPHDVSVMNDLVGAPPVSVAARGQAYLQDGIEDVVFVSLRYPGGRMGQIQVSWLDPHKVRRLTLVGSRKMAVFDDMEPAEKVRVYDKGAEVSQDYATYGEYLGLRHGDVVIPRLPAVEPLAAELEHFVECVRDRTPPRTGGGDGVAVVRVLEAASRSLAADGVPVALDGGTHGGSVPQP